MHTEVTGQFADKPNLWSVT